MPPARAALTAAVLALAPTVSSAQAPCPAAPLRPAYSHNDYLNEGPLRDALALGLRGAEADLFLGGGRLLVAHDRRDARADRTLESLYLAPLDSLVAACGRILPDSTPFLLNLELKQPSRAAFDTLLAALARHPASIGSGGVEVVLVGWHPDQAVLARLLPPQVRIQSRIASVTDISPGDPEGLVRLVSLDFGATVGWDGRGPLPETLDGWLAALRRAKAAGPHRLARVHDLPSDPALFARLAAGGVDLIGVGDLGDAGTRAALERLSTSVPPTPE